MLTRERVHAEYAGSATSMHIHRHRDGCAWHPRDFFVRCPWDLLYNNFPNCFPELNFTAHILPTMPKLFLSKS